MQIPPQNLPVLQSWTTLQQNFELHQLQGCLAPLDSGLPQYFGPLSILHNAPQFIPRLFTPNGIQSCAWNLNSHVQRCHQIHISICDLWNYSPVPLLHPPESKILWTLPFCLPLHLLEWFSLLVFGVLLGDNHFSPDSCFWVMCAIWINGSELFDPTCFEIEDDISSR